MARALSRCARTRRSLGRAAVLLGVLYAWGTGIAQAPDPSSPLFRTGVDLVRVDVSVTGDGNEPVVDLQASDFEVREDGVVQQVETVEFVRLDGTRSSDTDESLEIRSREHAAAEAARDDVRIFAIFLDDYHVDKDASTTQRVREALVDYVDLFGPNDLVAVMDPLTPLSHLEFTRSRDDLRLRMQGFEGRRFEVLPVRSPLERAQLSQPDVWALRGGVSLSALESLVTYLGGLREGRKSVLFVSSGPTIGSGVGNDERLQMVLQAANRGNVTIHTFDPRALGVRGLRRAYSLNRLASQTGGRAIANANQPGDRLAQTVADASAYYLLGYTPTRETDDGEFHRIEVKVNRRGVDVRARQGYWAPSADERSSVPTEHPEPEVQVALERLERPLSGTVDLWAGATRGTDGGTTVTFTWEPTGDAGAAVSEVTIEPIDAGAQPPAAGSPPSPDARTIPTEGRAEFDVPPGEPVTFQLVAIGDDGEVVDRWVHQMVAPMFGTSSLTLSTPRFLRAQSAYGWRVLTTSEDPWPAASRRFQRRDRLRVEVEWYGTGDREPAMTATLLNEHGDSLADLPVTLLDGGRARIDLPLSSLAAASYLLRLEAQAGDEMVVQRTAFIVE